ncbi:YoaK family protein [uncultured Massilia sp.]|uniref:YoaK family protein n=1 Tax=uncultured Massilia sp. TaxID=169973 RepID=UPI0025E06472|nr:YoaK family protein [uncultured Massilia sp.]
MVKPTDLTLGVCLGLIAGYVDTAGFVALFGLFTAHVTGNFVLIGTELARPSGGHVLLLKFLAVPAFAAGVIGARLLDFRCARLHHNPARPLLRLQLLLLVGFTVAGIVATPFKDAREPLVLLCGILGAAGMGVHNAAGKLQFGRLAPTTVMTGNVTELLIDMTDMASGRATQAVRERFVKFFWPVLAFALGCIAGGTAYVWFGFWCMLPALVLLAFLSLLDWPMPAAAPAAAKPA